MTIHQPTLTIRRALDALNEHHLLREVIQGTQWTLNPDDIAHADDPISTLTYDSRDAIDGAMLVCKGQFRPEYLSSTPGTPYAYVAETDFSAHTNTAGIIVNDVRKALAVLAGEYYGHPDRELTLVGITGTKGKTTTAYFTHAIAAAATDGHAALLSSVANCLDGRTWQASALTTPESLDALRMMRQAVDQGMTHLIMEVSSQAYKVHRVYGLTFDVGALLNISPDHISPIEHPTFEDYLYCKRCIIAHSRTLVVNAHADYLPLIEQDAQAHQVPIQLFDGDDSAQYHLSMPGDFNHDNASAAIAIARALGWTENHRALAAVEQVSVPGRMERFEEANGLTVVVDFAHNYLSCRTLIDTVRQWYDDPSITLVTGSAGGKGLDRRAGIVQAADGKVDTFVFTTDDPDREQPRDIADEMARHVTDERATVTYIEDREQAITQAIAQAATQAAAQASEQGGNTRHHVVLVIGKGDDRYITINGKHEPYEGDDHIVRRLLAHGDTTASTGSEVR